MNEIRRMAYLDAMGIAAYVSRAHLPGAAVTRRLAIVPNRATAVLAASMAAPAAAAVDLAPSNVAPQVPRIDSAARKPQPSPVTASTPPLQNEVSRFSLIAIVTGGWLWLEDMDGMPLAREQVQLVQAMAQTLAGVDMPSSAVAGPEIAQFDWPIHTNQQLDLGEEAALASVAGFVGRKLEQQRCRGLVLLGDKCAGRVPLAQLDCARAVSTVSSAQMLQNPQLKKQAWRDLLPFAGGK
jgi:hypothetical protein